MAGHLASLPSALFGLVDMGSNGIRFSITNVAAPLGRTLPTVYQDRLGVSLYDAQYHPDTHDKQPIPQDVIDEVIISLKRFHIVCSDFGLPGTNVRVLATEATRTAVNSEDYRSQIRSATGWEVDMLSKEMEGRVGAMGVASGFGGEGQGVEGLVMDLGGGSTQITWITSRDGNIQTSPQGSFSFPYGAAAMTRLLQETDTSTDPATARAGLAATMKQQFETAFHDLQLPQPLQDQARRGNLTLYLSGGGFRGWGYLLFSQHKINPYPIPIINGFTVSKHAFMQTASLELLVKETSEHADQQSSKGSGIFRISKRRAAQVPAVAFLVNVLVSAIPSIREIRFCQGGVREGFFFDALAPDIRAMHPLTCATGQYATSSSAHIAALLSAALPLHSAALDRAHPASLTGDITRALADLMYLHQSVPKESRAMAALHAPITGVLASVHGISHTDRALLSLALCARWDGEVAPPHDGFVTRLQNIVTGQEAWWAGYLGSVAGLVGNIYPAGIVPEGKERVRLRARWSQGLGKKGLEMGVRLTVFCVDGDLTTDKDAGIRDWVDDIEKIGKRKRREGMQRLRSQEVAGAGSGGGSGSGSATSGGSSVKSGESMGSLSRKGSGGGSGGFGVRVEVDVERVESLEGV